LQEQRSKNITKLNPVTELRAKVSEQILYNAEDLEQAIKTYRNPVTISLEGARAELLRGE
jgi:hypothetical protein